MTRAEKVIEAQRLRAEGLKFREIAKRMGVAIQTVDSWLNDPDGSRSRARKQSYGGFCVDCGRPTSAPQKGMAHERCPSCAESKRHQEARDRHIAAIRRFAERYDRPPMATDFNPPQARTLGHAWRAERWERDGDYTYAGDVSRVFGTWNAAIAAAGFEPTPQGKYERVRGEHRGAHLERERPTA